MKTKILHYGAIAGAAIAILTLASIPFNMLDKLLWNTTQWCFVCYEKDALKSDKEFNELFLSMEIESESITKRKMQESEIYGFPMIDIVKMSGGERLSYGIPPDDEELKIWFSVKRKEYDVKYCRYTHLGCIE